MSNSPSNEQVTPFSSSERPYRICISTKIDYLVVFSRPDGEHPFSKNSPLCLDGQIKLLSDHIIAGGGFSNVYLGELQLEGQKRSVAIKVIRAFDLHKNPKAAEKLIQVSPSLSILPQSNEQLKRQMIEDMARIFSVVCTVPSQYYGISWFLL